MGLFINYFISSLRTMHTKDLSLRVRKAIITHTLVIRTSCPYTEVAKLNQKLQKLAEKPFVTQKKRFRDNFSCVK